MDKVVEQKFKDRFLELLVKNYHKKKAASELGVDLVMVRSWRMKDPKFNYLYKSLTVGKNDAKSKVGLKEEFIELLIQGVSQREASRQLKISLPTIRTWKKNDVNFKSLVLKYRFNK